MADLIAAGEVVERPASVVKELCENAMDAGSSAITIEIKNGGMTYIRVTDDGCGMAYDDVETAFLRHATSKLLREEELSAIKTLGFRGEALAAICAVSRVELFTRERGAREGTYISIDGGNIIEKSPVGCPEGTTIIVRDLFFNTPARLKFMKKDTSEGSAVSAAAVRCALSMPNLSIRYIKDDKEEIHTPGDGRIESCIYTVLGRDFSNTMLKADASDEHVTVEGYVSSPSGARGNRSWQFFFINGRFVKSQLLQAALEQAYKNSLFSGRFPSCVLYLKLNPAFVDVNVHPAKTEVKFSSERIIFDAVYYAARAALGSEEAPPEIKYTAPIKTETRLSEPKFAPYSTPPQTMETTAGRVFKPSASFKATFVAKIEERESAREFVQTKISYNAPSEEVMPAKIEKEEKPAFRIIGEAMNSYIIVEQSETLYLIDKHAAHERMIFDRLKEKGEEITPQVLLTPAVAEVGREEAAALISSSALLTELGFDIEDFGGGAVAVNSVPMGISASEIAPLLTELCEDLKIGKKPGSLGIKDEILASIACRAAIKAGMVNDVREYKPLVERVMSGEIKYCPHGRPVTMELSKRTLDRNFKRA